MKQQNICYHFGLCGGCESQNLDYNIQLSQKQNYIKEKFKDFAVEQYCDIIPSPQVWYYRNKMEFVVGKEKTGEIVSGLRQKGKFYKIINLKECKISFENTLEILDILRNWVKESSIEPYDLVSHKGKVRYLVVKESKTNNKILLNLIVTGTKYQVENNEYDFIPFIC